MTVVAGGCRENGKEETKDKDKRIHNRIRSREYEEGDLRGKFRKIKGKGEMGRTGTAEKQCDDKCKEMEKSSQESVSEIEDTLLSQVRQRIF